MFNWLKNLFKTPSTIIEEGGVFPFPTAKGQDQSSMAPYKVEASGNVTPGNNTVSTVPKKTAPKKPATTKKKPAAGTKPAGNRGRKPKAKPAQ